MLQILQALGIIGALLFSSVTIYRATRKDTKEEGSSAGVIMTELGFIKAGVEDIKNKQDATDRRYTELAIAVGRVDECAKSAHKRLDEHVKKNDYAPP